MKGRKEGRVSRGRGGEAMEGESVGERGRRSIVHEPINREFC